MKKLCPIGDFIPAHIYSPAQTEHKKDSVISSLLGKTLTLPSIYKSIYKFANSFTNEPRKTNVCFTAFCFLYSLFIFAGDTDILQILRSFRSDGSAACGNAPSGTDLYDIVNLPLG